MSWNLSVGAVTLLRTSPPCTRSGTKLAATGLMLFIESVLYLQLPVDLIPDPIPLVGSLDNAAARMVASLGLALLGCAVAFDAHLRLNRSGAPVEPPVPVLPELDELEQESGQKSGQEPQSYPEDPIEQQEADEMSHTYWLWVLGTISVALGACMAVPGASQLVDNLLGLATGRLRIVCVGGERTVTTAF